MMAAAEGGSDSGVGIGVVQQLQRENEELAAQLMSRTDQLGFFHSTQGAFDLQIARALERVAMQNAELDSCHFIIRDLRQQLQILFGFLHDEVHASSQKRIAFYEMVFLVSFPSFSVLYFAIFFLLFPDSDE